MAANRVTYARASGLVRIPDTLSTLEASPLLCAGITAFNALRQLQAGPDALVAIHGIGGLGHLGVQYANKLGYRVAAIDRGAEKQVLARKLGAHHYIDSTVEDPAEALQGLGGAAAIIASAGQWRGDVTTIVMPTAIAGGIPVSGMSPAAVKWLVATNVWWPNPLPFGTSPSVSRGAREE